jgi:hypothetical protein
MTDTKEEFDINKLSPNLINYFDPNWKPPEKSGLTNSERIIPEYYKKKFNELISLDYFDIIIDDIRNLRKLNEYQLNYIYNLDNDSKQKLFIELNNLFDTIKTLIA